MTESDFISFMVTYQGQKSKCIFVMKKQYRGICRYFFFEYIYFISIDSLAEEFINSIRIVKTS